MERETLRMEVNLQRLYQQLLPTVYRAAYTYLKNPSDSEPELPAPSRDSGELLAALLTLPEKWKTALYLYYFEGYSVREIARAMGQPEGTVKSWLHRARGMLREALEEDV